MTQVIKYYGLSHEDHPLKYAVIIAKHNGKWVLCKHKDRNTYEFPGGHREENESIDDTARRELWEETGALDFSLTPVCIYSVTDNSEETFGMLFYSEIYSFSKLPEFEIEEVKLFSELPNAWTYPAIQPKLLKKVESTLSGNRNTEHDSCFRR